MREHIPNLFLQPHDKMNKLWKSLQQFFSSQWGSILIVFASLVILLKNFNQADTIMGLDNASPWFGLSFVFNLIHKSDSFIEFGPLLFSPFLQLGYAITAHPALISQIVYWGNFLLGMLGFLILLTSSERRNKNILLVISFTLVLGHLVTLWIFSQPTYLFLHAFSGVPWLIYVLKLRRAPSAFLLLPAAFGFFSFLVTFLNPVAFTLYFVLCVVIAYFLEETLSISTLVKRSILVGIILLFIIQTSLLLSGRNTPLWTDIQAYTQVQIESSSNILASQSLRKSEIENNSLTNVMRFATGWMELNDLENRNLFTHKDVYQKSILFIIIQLSPIAFISWWYLRKKRGTRKQRKLLIAYFLAVVLSSTYFLILIGGIPYLSDAWRWPTSKVWPLLTIPVWYLFLSTLSEIPQRRIFFALCVVIIGLLIQSFPWVTGQVVTKYALHEFPQEYRELQVLTSEDTVLVLQNPQKGQFRYYDWGYYGTDFLSFLTHATIIDGTRTNAVNKDYRKLTENPESWYSAKITHVVVDSTLQQSNTLTITDFLTNHVVILDTPFYKLYRITYD